MKNLSLVLRRLILLGVIAAILGFHPGIPLYASSATTNVVSTDTIHPGAVVIESTNKTIRSDDEDDDKDHSLKLTIDGDDSRHNGNHESSMDSFMDNIIPLTGIVATFGAPVLIVFFVFYFQFRQRREKLALAREYLNKGLTVPPELLGSSQAPADIVDSRNLRHSSSDLRKGFRLAFIGLGVTLALYVYSPHSTMWGWGLIPMIMGIGFILSGWIESRRESSPDSTNRPPSPPGNPL